MSYKFYKKIFMSDKFYKKIFMSDKFYKKIFMSYIFYLKKSNPTNDPFDIYSIELPPPVLT